MFHNFYLYSKAVQPTAENPGMKEQEAIVVPNEKRENGY